MDSRLAAYLERLGLAAPPALDAAGLETVQCAHRLAIPFENLDIRLGRSVAIDSDNVFAKLVSARRGGYCFEHNRLLADILGLLGISSRPLLARVQLGSPSESPPPRTHVLLLAELPEGPWIADVGFGGSHLPPLPLNDGASAETSDGARHRLRRIGEQGALGGEWLLERARPEGDWQPQYTFDLGQVAQADLEQANHWTATEPTSRFVTLHIATRALPAGFASLIDRSLTITGVGGPETREIPDRPAYRETLRKVFGLDLPDADIERLTLF